MPATAPVTELGRMDPHLGLNWPRPPASAGKVLFPLGVVQTKMKPKLKSKQRKPYSMAREWKAGNLLPGG